jgi:hypothetical protein
MKDLRDMTLEEQRKLTKLILLSGTRRNRRKFLKKQNG